MNNDINSIYLLSFRSGRNGNEDNKQTWGIDLDNY